MSSDSKSASIRFGVSRLSFGEMMLNTYIFCCSCPLWTAGVEQTMEPPVETIGTEKIVVIVVMVCKRAVLLLKERQLIALF